MFPPPRGFYVYNVIVASHDLCVGGGVGVGVCVFISV